MLNPNDPSHMRYLLLRPGAVATVSLMAIRAECLRRWLSILSEIEISVEAFIPAVASKCGYLYHTSRRLTRYRIHDLNTSIPNNKIAELRRLFYNLRRAVYDHELILKEVLRDDYYSFVLRRFYLEAKYALSTSGYRRIFNDAYIKPWEILELCMLARGCIDYRCRGYDYLHSLRCWVRALAHLLLSM
jgi:hypothetical protein